MKPRDVARILAGGREPYARGATMPGTDEYSALRLAVAQVQGERSVSEAYVGSSTPGGLPAALNVLVNRHDPRRDTQARDLARLAFRASGSVEGALDLLILAAALLHAASQPAGSERVGGRVTD